MGLDASSLPDLAVGRSPAPCPTLAAGLSAAHAAGRGSEIYKEAASTWVRSPARVQARPVAWGGAVAQGGMDR
jgi:hypothetical protein